MSIKMGPLLRFRGQEGDNWNVSALIVIEGTETPSLTIDDESVVIKEPIILKEFKEEGKFNEYKVLRYDILVIRTDDEKSVTYKIGDSKEYEFSVPGLKKEMRIAYGSCAGFHEKPSVRHTEKNELWQIMLNHQKETPYHLLIMGGDQVYADELLHKAEFDVWLEKSYQERLDAPFTPEMEKSVQDFYFNLYCTRWKEPEPATCYASIPTIMMWDDHDIFDGWGSYEDELQECDVFQGIYKQARKYFRIFQLQSTPAELKKTSLCSQINIDKSPNDKSNLSYAFQIGDIAIVALDLRSERTMNRVVRKESWIEIFKWIGNIKNAKHLLLLSSIPVVYPSINWLADNLIGYLSEVVDIRSNYHLQDDVLDQWMSFGHRNERAGLIKKLLDISIKTKCRVTIISGDVHLGALGYIRSNVSDNVNENAKVINQLVSSAIVNNPPNPWYVYGLEKFSDKSYKDNAYYQSEMLQFRNSGKYFINAKNWLSLKIDSKNRIQAKWHLKEELEAPYIKEIDPIKD